MVVLLGAAFRACFASTNSKEPTRCYVGSPQGTCTFPALTTSALAASAIHTHLPHQPRHMLRRRVRMRAEVVPHRALQRCPVQLLSAREVAQHRYAPRTQHLGQSVALSDGVWQRGDGG